MVNVTLVIVNNQMKKLILALIASISICAHANEYITVGHNSDMKYEFVKGEILETTNSNGEQIVVVEGRVSQYKPKKVMGVFWYITYVDCLIGYGQLSTTDDEGKFFADVPFSLGDQRSSSSVAGHLCHDLRMENAEFIKALPKLAKTFK